MTNRAVGFIVVLSRLAEALKRTQRLVNDARERVAWMSSRNPIERLVEALEAASIISGITLNFS
jgi:hypothetical protein